MPDDDRPSVEELEKQGAKEQQEQGQKIESNSNARVRSKLQSILIVGACFLGMVTAISSLTSVSIALPMIGRYFHQGPNNLQWLMSAYALTNGCFLILFGRLADLYGRKHAFLIGSGFMGIFPIGCGFAPNLVGLAIMRAFQGMGPAAIIPASIGILAEAFPPSPARSIAFATFSAGAPIGGAIGYNLGGVVTEFAPKGWRDIFFITAGFCVLIFINGLVVMDRDKIDPKKDKRIDWLGAFLVTSGLACLLFVLGDGTVAPMYWTTPYIIGLLIVGIFLLTLFILWEYHLTKRTSFPPLMKLDIWTRGNGKFAVVQAVVFLEWAGFNTWTFWTPLYYQLYLRLPPILAMVRLLPMTVTGVICNVVIALAVGRIKANWLITLGTISTALAGLLFAVIDPTASYWAFGFPAAILSVIGADFVYATGTLFVAKIALPGEQSVAGALFQTLAQLGTAFGLTISTIAHNCIVIEGSMAEGIKLDPSGRGAPDDAMLKGFKSAQWCSFGFAITAAILGCVFLRGVGVVGHHRPKPPAPSTPLHRDEERGGGGEGHVAEKELGTS